MQVRWRLTGEHRADAGGWEPVGLGSCQQRSQGDGVGANPGALRIGKADDVVHHRLGAKGKDVAWNVLSGLAIGRTAEQPATRRFHQLHVFREAVEKRDVDAFEIVADRRHWAAAGDGLGHELPVRFRFGDAQRIHGHASAGRATSGRWGLCRLPTMAVCPNTRSVSSAGCAGLRSAAGSPCSVCVRARSPARGSQQMRAGSIAHGSAGDRQMGPRTPLGHASIWLVVVRKITSGVPPPEEREPAVWQQWLGVADHGPRGLLEVAEAASAGATLPGLETFAEDDRALWDAFVARLSDPNSRWDWRRRDSRREAALGLATRCDAAELWESLRLGDPLVATRESLGGTVVTGNITALPARTVLEITLDQLACRLREQTAVEGFPGYPRDLPAAAASAPLLRGRVAATQVTRGEGLVVTIGDAVVRQAARLGLRITL